MYFLDHDGGTIHTIERRRRRRRKRRLPDTAVADRLVRVGQGPHAGGRRGPVRDQRPAMAGRRDGGALGRLPGRVVRHPLRDRQADPRHGGLAQLPHALPRKTRCWCRTLSLAAGGWRRKCCIIDGVDWRAYTFAWRDDQTDADLVPADGAEKEVRTTGRRTRVWQFHSRSQCMSCHSNRSEYRAGVPAGAVESPRARRPQPARRPHARRASSAGPARTASRCRRSTPDRPPGSAGSPTRPTPASRWRPGPGPTCTPIAATATPIGGGGSVRSAAAVLRDDRRDEGDRRPPDPRRLRAAGRRDHQAGRSVGEHPVFPHGQVRPRSDAAHRLRTDRTKTGLKLIARWIAGMSKDAEEPDRDPAGGPPGQLLASPRSAVEAGAKARTRRAGRRRASRVAGRGRRSSRPARFATCSRAICHRTSEEGESSARTPGRGPSWPSKAIPRRGEKLFWSQPDQCGSCHRSATGARRSGRTCRRSESFVRARTCWRAFWSRRGGSSRSTPPMSLRRPTAVSLTGLLVRRDEKGVVLRDSQNKEIVLAAKDVEELRPSRASFDARRPVGRPDRPGSGRPGRVSPLVEIRAFFGVGWVDVKGPCRHPLQSRI